MQMNNAVHKVSESHLRRNAYLYIRQSTMHQVFAHQESTKRQYELRQQAIALGWPAEQIIVIDTDLGQSGASSQDRAGFQKLVAEVGSGKAGIVMGLEVSRLTRKSSDWHQLLELCDLTDTLLLDEDGLYNPGNHNDRLVLGLKGTMSEAELYVMKARLLGGLWNKARRGELPVFLPTGFVYDSAGRVSLDPDQQVQESFGMLFSTFTRTGSAMGVVKEFVRKGLLFPQRVRGGLGKGELHWVRLNYNRCLQMLHNPRYAGAFVYGRTRTVKTIHGVRYEHVPAEQWILIPDMHAGYISWEQYQSNQKQLLENARTHGKDRHGFPPREGPALLQGIVMCGRCGSRMTVRYHHRKGVVVPDYFCLRNSIAWGEPPCQRVSGWRIDEAVGRILVEAITPQAVELTLAVQEELQKRMDEADGLRAQQVERVRYEAELAQRRYLQVDPLNRLVAATLEADWNNKLRMVEETQREYERLRERDRMMVDETQRKRLGELVREFPRLWSDPKTADREKKRMARLLVEDVTLRQDEQITVQIRFRGGATQTLTLPRPLTPGELRRTQASVVAEIDRLLEAHTYQEIATKLNEGGFASGGGAPFTSHSVRHLRVDYGLKSLLVRLREKGFLTPREMAQRLGISKGMVVIWGHKGLLKSHTYNDRGMSLYEPPPDDLPPKWYRKSSYLLAKACSSDLAERVQYEA